MHNKHSIYDKKIYWIGRNKLKSLFHYFNVKIFKFKDNINIEKDRFGILRSSITSISKNIFRAFLFVVVLYIIEYTAEIVFESLKDNLSDKFVNVITKIPKPVYPKILDSVVNLISLLASVSGVLLALFYPILATIASTAYSKVNSSIRNLLFVEPATQKYLRDLAFVTSYSVYVLFFITLGFYPGNLILLILTVYCLYSLFNLLKLGTGVYNLFEPQTLFSIVRVDLIKNLNQVLLKSPYWENENFQYYFRRQVEGKISLLRLINEISFEGIASDRNSLTETMKMTFELMNYYLGQKKRISISSKWFKDNVYHNSYFEVSSSERELAYSTEKYLMPKKQQNYLWFEEEILDIYEEIGLRISKLNNQKISYNYINQTKSSIYNLGYLMEFDLAEKLLEINFKITIDSLNFDVEKEYYDIEDNLILIESFINVCFGNFCLGLFQRIEDFDKVKLDNNFEIINWRKKESIYKINIPPFLQIHFEEYYNKLQKEIRIESDIITPNWFIKQHISAEYLLKVKNTLERTIFFISKYVLKLVVLCNDKKNELITSFATHNAIGVIDRVEFRLNHLESKLNNFDENNKLKENFIWTKFDFNGAKEVLENLRRKLIVVCSHNMYEISKIKWDKKYPDIFSHSYLLISKQLSVSLLEGDLDLYKKLFPEFLKSIITGYDFLQKRYLTLTDDRQEIVYQVHIELMQICGISYIYSKLHKKPFWDFTLSALYNENFSNEKLNLFIASFLYFKHFKFGVGINSTDNFNRERDLKQFIKNNDVDDIIKSDIILKYYLDKSYMEDDFEEIFIELFLATFIQLKPNILKIDEISNRNLFDKINSYYEKKGF